jgi:ketosteroid isomerase-like protein
MLRRCLLVFALFSAGVTSSWAAEWKTQSPRTEAEVRQFVASFLRAFDDLDWPTFRSCFDDDASVFYPEFFPRRVQGQKQLDASWRTVFENVRTQSGRSSSPYMDLKPVDTQIRIRDKMAIVTFHLEHGGSAVGRRTLILSKGANGWRIVHLHASNVDFGSAEK